MPTPQKILGTKFPSLSSRLTMASKKRSAEAGDGGTEKMKTPTTDQVTKRKKNSNRTENEPSSFTTTAPQKLHRPAKSVVPFEGKAFPRGGGSVLTPLEQKQIQNEAARDVLFEQSGAKRPAPDEEDFGQKKELSRPSKKRRKSKVVVTGNDQLEKPRLDRVEGLSYRRLVPGSIVLGQITQITSRDIALALPNNLTGYVPITAISDSLDRKIEKLLNVDQEEDDNEEEDGNDFDVSIRTPCLMHSY